MNQYILLENYDGTFEVKSFHSELDAITYAKINNVWKAYSGQRLIYDARDAWRALA